MLKVEYLDLVKMLIYIIILIQDSSLPAAVFVWDIQNNSPDPKLVKITFTFQNGIGDKCDKAAGCSSEEFSRTFSGQKISGVLIHHEVDEMPYTFAVSAAEKV